MKKGIQVLEKWKRQSFFSEQLIEKHSLTSCKCDLHYIDLDPSEVSQGHSVWSDHVKWSKPCVVHICEIPNVIQNKTMVQRVKNEKQIHLNVILNRISKGDIQYNQTDIALHECKQKVGTKWQTFMLEYDNEQREVFQKFDLQLSNILDNLQSSGSISETYHLVAVEAKDEPAPVIPERVPIYIDHNDNYTAEVTDEINNNPSSPETKNRKPDTFPTISLPPPFDPAPYERHLNGTRQEPDLKCANLKVTKDELSESLYIKKTELPQSLRSILESVDKQSIPNPDRVIVELNSHKPTDIDVNHRPSSNTVSDVERLNSEFLTTEELYIPMGVKPEPNIMDQTKANPKLQSIQKLGQLLQTAVNNKDVQHAQEYAGKLALEEAVVTIDVKSKSTNAEDKDKEFNLKVHIEDKESSGGSIILKVKSSDTIRDLKYRMLMKHLFPMEVQYWIIGKRIPAETETLRHCGIRDAGQHSVFLYLVSAKSAGIDKDEFLQRQAQAANPDYVIVEPLPKPGTTPAAGGNKPGHRRDSTPTPGSAGKKDTAIPKENFKVKDEKGTPNKKLIAPGPPVPKQLAPVLRRDKDQSGQDIANILRTIAPDLEVAQVAQAGAQERRNLNSFLEGPRGSRVPVMHPEEDEEPQYGWACDACTFINQPTRPGCEVCGNPRPEDYEMPADYVISEEEQQRLEMEQMLEQRTREVEEGARVAELQDRQRNYQYLQQADNHDVIANTEPFQCPICFDDIEEGEGVMLRECLHSFCRECIKNAVFHNEEPVLKCPFQDDNYACDGVIQHREIKGVVPPNIYEKYLARSLTTAESQAKNSFHCKTADCAGWCTYEDHVNFFVCPVCRKENCLTCKVIHQGMNCKQYQEDLKLRANNDKAASQTQIMIKKMLDDGDAMSCPQCQVIVMKKEGCDWIQCSICKTEICWVTKGPRWGPLGSGDISGGCMCRVNGQQCHPQCQNCH